MTQKPPQSWFARKDIQVPGKEEKFSEQLSTVAGSWALSGHSVAPDIGGFSEEAEGSRLQGSCWEVRPGTGFLSHRWLILLPRDAPLRRPRSPGSGKRINWPLTSPKWKCEIYGQTPRRPVNTLGETLFLIVPFLSHMSPYYPCAERHGCEADNFILIKDLSAECGSPFPGCWRGRVWDGELGGEWPEVQRPATLCRSPCVP